MNSVIKPVRTRVKTCWAYPAGLIWRVLGINDETTASPMGKYICDDAGRARDTPPPSTRTCNPAIFFVFLGV